MMHRLWRYDAFAFANMILLVALAMMRCLPKQLAIATSLGEAVIINEVTSLAIATSFAARQTSFQK